MTNQTNPPRARWKQSDVTRVCKGVIAAGQEIAHVRLDPFTGEIIVFTGQPSPDGAAASDWD